MITRLLASTLLLIALPVQATTEHAWPTIDHVLGRADAPITVIEYASLTCSHCAEFDAEVLPKLQKDWIDSGKIKLVVRDFPRDPLDQAASMIAQCSGERYFAFHSAYFRSQQNWLQSNQPLDALKSIARLGGMSSDDVNRCLSDRSLLGALTQRKTEGQDLYQIVSTPTFVINGRVAEYDGTFEGLARQLPR